MAKKLSKQEWEQKISEAGSGLYEFVRWAVDGRCGSRDKCVVRCVKDGCAWESTVNNLVNHGSGCHQCAGKRRRTADERIEHINSLENIEFVSWVNGYKNSHSKAIVRCKIDLFRWTASVNNLVNGGYGCPHCAGQRRWTAEERVEQINSLENIEFVSWHDGYKNKNSKANVRCAIDWYEWCSTVSSLVNNGHSCPQCAGVRRWTHKERIKQINSIENIEFVSWVGKYKNKNSKANVRCTIDSFEWLASVSSLVHSGCGCPNCAKSGYDPSKTGTLYALRSECGKYVKVGISNKPKQRHRQLELATPFSFSCIEQISGDGVKIYELEKYFHDKYERAGFTGFDGATEWLVCTPELLEEIRNLGDKCGL